MPSKSTSWMKFSILHQALNILLPGGDLLFSREELMVYADLLLVHICTTKKKEKGMTHMLMMRIIHATNETLLPQKLHPAVSCLVIRSICCLCDCSRGRARKRRTNKQSLLYKRVRSCRHGRPVSTLSTHREVPGYGRM